MTKQAQRMIKGTLVLSIAGIFAKIISAFYKVPLEGMIGIYGLGLYNMTYPLYSMLTAAGLMGIPNSVSKLVAEELALNEYNKAHQTFRMAFIITGALGLAISLILFMFSHEIVAASSWRPDAYYALIGLSFAPLFIGIAGAIRGYLQGMQVMLPTGISQIIENLFKVIIGIGLVSLLQSGGQSIPVQVGGAALGVSIGMFLSAIYLSIVYFKKRKTIKLNIEKNDKGVIYSKKEIAKKIAYIAIPVTIASASYSIFALIDSMTIPSLLTETMIIEGITDTTGTYVMGLFAKIQTIVNVPLVISVSLIISIVPSISAANVLKNKDELKIKIKEAIEIGLKLALPAAAGIIVLAEPILNLLYTNADGYKYLQVLAIGLVFMILSQSFLGILQGLSKYYTSLIVVVIAGIVKLGVNVIFIQTSLKGYGALVGTVLYYVVITCISYIVIKRQVDFKQSLTHGVLKPLVSSGIMGIITYISYQLVYNLLIGNLRMTYANVIATAVSVLFGIVIYAVVMVALKAFTRDEIMILPKSNNIIAWLEKHRLIKE